MISPDIRKDGEAVSPVIAIILMVAITVVLAGVLYVWVTSLADTDSGQLEHYFFEGELSESSKTLTLDMTRGPPIKWGDYKLTMDEVQLDIPVNQSEVGDLIFIDIKDEYGITLEKGQAYKLSLINIEESEIMWEDIIKCKG